MKNKLIKDINENIWRKFTAYCKLKGVKVGDELNNLLKDHLKKKLNKLFKK